VKTLYSLTEQELRGYIKRRRRSKKATKSAIDRLEKEINRYFKK